MVILPLIVGVIYSGGTWLDVPLAIAWMSGYFCFFAAGLLFKVRRARRGNRRRQYAIPTAVYGAVSLVATIIVIVARPHILLFGFLFAPLIAVALWEAWNKRSRSLLSGLSTTVASALLIPVAAALTGRLDTHTWWITLVVALYFSGTVPVVKTLIRRRGDARMLWFSIGFHALAAVVCAGAAWCGWLGWTPTFFFILLTVRAWVMPTVNNRRIAAGEAPMTAKFVGRWESLWTVLLVVAVFTA